ncbi:hypothetical protein [Tardiphaga alba]|nr:hypothetical protein [Tardiphaga alba]
MAPFKMQERDLDLFILEELHSNTNFQIWFAEKVGLAGYAFLNAEHSVYVKINEKWGETDVLSFFKKGEETVAVLVEDKIAAAFADQQVERYHERGADLVKLGRANRYATALIAPNSYFEKIPKGEDWSSRISIEELRDWFSSAHSSYARWREQALTDCLDRLSRSKAAGSAVYLRFSEEFAAFLKEQPDSFSHVPTGDSWGYFISHPEKPKNVQLIWKTGMNRVDLSLTGPNVGKAKNIDLPLSVRAAFADGKSLASDMLGIDVPAIDVTISIGDQLDIVIDVLAAVQELFSLIPIILAHPGN